MIETTHVWSVSLSSEDPGVRNALAKKYGSKKSGTVYVIADTHGEAQEVVREMFTRNGYKAPTNVFVTQAHLVKQALRMSY